MLACTVVIDLLLLAILETPGEQSVVFSFPPNPKAKGAFFF